jgi:processive 1,2-diacylglycerol beta-glucosyltransferase
MARILILTVSHGAAHRRVAVALQKALLETDPSTTVDVEDILEHVTGWFRAYYSSYEIPLRYWPQLWGWIEGLQHAGAATSPGWIYRRGARPLFRFITQYRPDAVVATETGVLEIAALCKRFTCATWYLVGIDGLDVDRAWAQPEVGLYAVTPDPVAKDLAAWGIPANKIIACGMPLDPAFLSRPDRDTARRNLGVASDTNLLLVLFGGTGFGRPRAILGELVKVKRPFQAVLITGRNERLHREAAVAAQALRNQLPNCITLGWVDNMHEWLAAADIVVNKPSGLALLEAMACGVPFLALDPLPGNERRHCDLIECWGVGHWVRNHGELAAVVERLLDDPSERMRMGDRGRSLSQPRAAYGAADAILKLTGRRNFDRRLQSGFG